MLKFLGQELVENSIAVLPMVTVITILLLLLRLPVATFGQLAVGTLLVVPGLCLFLAGLKMGLLPVGEMIGSEMTVRGTTVTIILAALALGFTVTVAEPDVRVLAHQADLAFASAISVNTLVLTVAVGTAVFLAFAVFRIFLNIPSAYLLICGYILVIILSLFAPPQFVPLAFDAGGVTTGPVTVPFILALGVGTASTMAGKSALSDGFGLVGIASIGPIIAVMLLGMILS